jgi:5-methylcytosine-specific restriction endonuclease McrBC GTP-binding regulatory subunit McrB
VQFHPSTTYEDFIRGIRTKTDCEKITYEAQNAIFGEMCVEAAKDPNNYYILIVDEINRANLPSVFGELIYALEYRGEAVNTPYEANSSKELTVPHNLVVIGTMNTADRSVGQMDYAIRRRFQFFPLLPDVQKVTDSDAKKTFQNVLRLFVKNPTTSPIDWSERAETLSHDFRASDVAIGHTYFLGQDWKNSFKFQVLPMLVEYLKDGVLLESINIKDETPCSKIEKIHFETLDKPAKDVVSKFDNLFIKQGGA